MIGRLSFQRRGIKIDEYDFTLVDLDQCINGDSFVLASQVEQVSTFQIPLVKVG